jgi:alpha-galactosidase
MIIVHSLSQNSGPSTPEFHLQTANTSYIFRVSPTGHLLQLHYGHRLADRPDFATLVQGFATAWGSSTIYSPASATFNLDACALEWSSEGKGDYRELAGRFTFSGEVGFSGTSTQDPRYLSHRVLEDKPTLEGLPSTFGKKIPTLEITLRDELVGLQIVLSYSVFEDLDVIARSVKVTNTGVSPLTIDALASVQLDFAHDSFELVTLDGKWIAERTPHRRPLSPGLQGIDSKKGVSSANHNPFVALLSPGATETSGEAYGIALVYSGNHRCLVEVSPHAFTRVLAGINPHDFAWHLAPGATFQSPEAVLTFSARGVGGMSRNYHSLVQKHLVSAQWQEVERPVLINNWEATYFDFNEGKLVKLAKAAAKLGIELFVLDDGWFGKRDNDTTSLGDWFEHKKKLPNGLGGLSAKIRQTGLQFGLWVEPEMVSVDSDLYRSHPEWALRLPGREPSFGRFQLLLDMGNPEVQNYLFTILSGVFTRAQVSYVKWDHNRNFSDVFSSYLPPERQKELAHRYVLGLYALLERLNVAFPQVLFESCSSGGNRFDLGMLAYMPQTWTSDNTDAVERLGIQWGTSYLYPPSTMGAHVSGAPSHQVLRTTPLETRFHVAAFGLLGYELDLTKLSSFDLQVIEKQVAYYKAHRRLFQFGSFHRLQSPIEGNVCLWIAVSPDQSEALLGYYQKLQRSNPSLETLKLSGLNPEAWYELVQRTQYLNVGTLGDLIGQVAPLPITPNGLVHTILSQNYLHSLATESCEARGDELHHAGFRPMPQFSGTGVNNNVRLIGDFGSRVYFLKAVAGK